MKNRKYTLEGKEVSYKEFIKGIKAGKSGTDIFLAPVASHTPTPWFKGPEYYLEDKTLQCAVYAGDPNGHSCSVARHVASQDAEFIVRAVNAHDELVSMLATFRHYIEMTGKYPNAVAAADKLLAKAEGKAAGDANVSERGE